MSMVLWVLHGANRKGNNISHDEAHGFGGEAFIIVVHRGY